MSKEREGVGGGKDPLCNINENMTSAIEMSQELSSYSRPENCMIFSCMKQKIGIHFVVFAVFAIDAWILVQNRLINRPVVT